MEDRSNFTLSQDVQEEIDIRLRGLLEVCQIHKIPMFASVVIANSSTGSNRKTKYNNIVYNAPSHGLELADDQISKHVLIANGFDAVPKRESVSFDVEDLH